ncbi:MAG TPA: RNA-binding transcriptional accessory protein [Bavariicoccus seileri]|uniref:RNA-binding transcriptional accessory protein n=2 Tax=Bavariicoccus seileri TaxID=549685 RepID=A0A3D4S7A3_9ENTE|nr:Tex family protein [Bavariicoccus seileri]HCS93831.1 RNA-binding transcriptional accessory protein [Bavariicoccus seileri]
MTDLEKEVVRATQRELSTIPPHAITAVLKLLAEGNTVPFIARYRKEVTGSLDEVQIKAIQDRHHFYEQLFERQETVLKAIDEQGKLTPELRKAIKSSDSQQALEDLYRPYKQKKQTKATIARDKGLAPLAEWFLSNPSENEESVSSKASQFMDSAKELESVEDVLNGAHEILAEIIGDSPKFRQWMRRFTHRTGLLVTQLKKGAEDESATYRLYYDFEQPVRKLLPHQILAINRAEKEQVISVKIAVDMAAVDRYFTGRLITNQDTIAKDVIEKAYQDSYKRFIGPAIERDIRNELTEIAQKQAISVFGENLKNLLMQAPMSGITVLGFDPAYRTGCKLAIVDPTGKVLTKSVIYPHPPASAQKRSEAVPQFKKLLLDYDVDCVAIGNGTASRESEQFVSDIIKEIPKKVYYVMVNEAGASVYSASEIARLEFPDYQVEERSAVSIARRLQDPLAELVKIDPKAVGVGQYQHDVSQTALKDMLDFVVLNAVNQVGVDLNTASPSLLEHISGLTKSTSQNIVRFREDTGLFTKRNDLKKVKRLGPKAYEQAVGFLRIAGGDQPLDNTAIHPESYNVAKAILKAIDKDISAIGTAELNEDLKTFDITSFCAENQVGQETVNDIIEQLQKPGRDPRDDVPKPILRADVLKMTDLTVGMSLTGTVRNVVDFGAFVDIGVKQDGLVHISRLSRKFVKNPSDVVAVGDIVKVWVTEIDAEKGRIGLSMLSPKDEQHAD